MLNLVSNRLDDTTEPFRWSDEELTAYYNQRIMELCVIFPWLLDVSSVQITPISVTAGSQVYPYDGRITAILEARMTLSDFPMDIKTMEYLRRAIPHWQSLDGDPLMLITDYKQGHVLLVPNPETSDTLNLSVARTPLYELDYTQPDNQIPDLPEHLHWLFIPGITSLAYRKADAETEDLKRAMADQAEWMANLELLKKFFINLHGAPNVAVPHQAFI
jgi:hypothetical protein